MAIPQIVRNILFGGASDLVHWVQSCGAMVRCKGAMARCNGAMVRCSAVQWYISTGCIPLYQGYQSTVPLRLFHCTIFCKKTFLKSAKTQVLVEKNVLAAIFLVQCNGCTGVHWCIARHRRTIAPYQRTIALYHRTIAPYHRTTHAPWHRTTVPHTSSQCTLSSHLPLYHWLSHNVKHCKKPLVSWLLGLDKDR